MSARPALVVLDIEGTTAPIAFVHDVLFPYAAKTLPALLTERADHPVVREAVAEIARLAPGVPPLDQLRAWMAQDAKVAPLKTLQGLAWEEGYARGDLTAVLYPDVLPALRAWSADGVRLAVYSSGSAAAQRLIYGHTSEGDARDLFEAFFDLATGPKRESESYVAIARASALSPDAILFLSDIPAELAAARTAGLRVCQIVRPQDGTVTDTDFPHAPDLLRAGAEFGLPA